MESDISLRTRLHNVEQTRYAPFVQTGRMTAIDEDHVVMSVGPTIMELAIDDIAPHLGGPETARRLLRNAAENHDMVTFHIFSDRIAYDNPAQLDRVPAGES